MPGFSVFVVVFILFVLVDGLPYNKSGGSINRTYMGFLRSNWSILTTDGPRFVARISARSIVSKNISAHSFRITSRVIDPTISTHFNSPMKLNVGVSPEGFGSTNWTFKYFLFGAALSLLLHC